MGKIFQCIQKKLERSAINATFSVESFKNSVLAWWMFMTSPMKAAIHLGPDFFNNLEMYKNTRFENIEIVCNITQKLMREAWMFRHHHGRDQHCSKMTWVGDGKSLRLRRFSSMCWSNSMCWWNRTSTASRKCKFGRTNGRSQKVSLVPRRNWTRHFIHKALGFSGYHNISYISLMESQLPIHIRQEFSQYEPQKSVR